MKQNRLPDLITSMEQSLHEIKKAMVVYQTLEKEFRATRQINFDLQHINLELKQEVKDLKKIIEFMGGIIPIIRFKFLVVCVIFSLSSFKVTIFSKFI